MPVETKQDFTLLTVADITLTGVHADSNASHGATLDTCTVSGGICTKTGTGKVTINDSTFDNNGPTVAGLEITSRGAVILSNVSASGNNLNAANTSPGAIIHTEYSQLVSPVTITNSQFNLNDAGGLEVYAKGAITLTKVKANENTLGHGAYLDNGDYGIASISILGSAYSDNEFNNNGVIGLSVHTKGKIILNYATANGNQNVAIVLDNQSGVGSVTLKSGWFGNTSQPNSYGVNIVTNGAVTITGVFARGNDSMGLSIDQSGTIPQPIKITGGDFSDNGEQGLHIWSQGSITLANIFVSNTGREGFNLVTEKPANITLTNCHISSTGDAAPSAGLYFMTAGNIVLNSVSSNNNSDDGLHIQVGSAGTPKSITITNGNFNGNLGDGLELFSTGAITLKNTNAYGNTGYGALLDNTSGTAGITITNSALPEDIYKLISPVDDDHDILKRDFSKNGSTGLWINSLGAVSITNAIVGKNGGAGVYVVNANTPLAGYKPVTLKNMRIFENQSTGLEVYSEGPITLMDVFSWYHNLSDGSYGARLLNNMEDFKTPVTVKNTNGKSIYGFSVNRETSLYIRSYGIVTLEGVSANNCLDSGCRGININSSASNTIIKNTSTYGNNGGGLYIRTTGAIIVNGGSSSSNTGIGADLFNSYGLPSPISITNYGTSSNTSDEFQVVSNGNISLSNTSGYNNGGYGAYLDNFTCANCFVKLLGKLECIQRKP